MAFYHYRQNNSYGKWDENEIVQQNLIIEAPTAKEANARFWEIVNSYRQSGDCPCCGDRWYSAHENGDSGDSVPLVYGESVLLYENDDTLSESVEVAKGKSNSKLDIDTVVYYADGSKSFGLAPSMW